MIKGEVYNYNKEQMIDWLRNEAGSSNPDIFNAKKAGGLKLQQVPEEYAELLLLLKESGARSYLELGVGNGGSFLAACFMMKETLIDGSAVDCLAYKDLGIGQSEQEISAFVKKAGEFRNGMSGTFFNITTDAFFETAGVVKDANWDVIFIDADHSYEGVKKDFVNAQKHINEGGIIIFHDIASDQCPGVVRLWNEIKQQCPERCIEFIHSTNCGIGVVKY